MMKMKDTAKELGSKMKDKAKEFVKKVKLKVSILI